MMQMVRRGFGIFAIALCAIAATRSASVAADANFAGTWVIAGTISNPAGGEYIQPTCTFKVDGKALSGSCVGPHGMGSVDGSVDGDTIVFNYDRIATSDVSRDAKLTFRGQVDSSGVLRGQWKDSTIEDTVGVFVGLKKQ